jgi:hypothetical protein
MHDRSKLHFRYWIVLRCLSPTKLVGLTLPSKEKEESLDSTVCCMHVRGCPPFIRQQKQIQILRWKFYTSQDKLQLFVTIMRISLSCRKLVPQYCFTKKLVTALCFFSFCPSNRGRLDLVTHACSWRAWPMRARLHVIHRKLKRVPAAIADHHDWLINDIWDTS